MQISVKRLKKASKINLKLMFICKQYSKIQYQVTPIKSAYRIRSNIGSVYINFCHQCMQTIIRAS